MISMIMGLHRCLTLLEQEHQTEEMKASVLAFLEKASFSSKWMLYSDYCLDDKKKPNDVITFVLIPFLSESHYLAMDKIIGTTQTVDIKHTQSVDATFLDYIRQQAIFSFSFIVNDRHFLFGNSDEEQTKNVVHILADMKNMFVTWRENTEDESLIKYYTDTINIIKRQEKLVFQKKNIKNLMDIFLIATLGAYYTASILKQLPALSVFGWFPDRDKTNEACGQLVTPVFNALHYNYSGSIQYQFVTGVLDSKNVPFYDNENRIADTICGTLADYNINENTVSKDKFSEVLKFLFANNNFVKVYRFFFDGDKLHLGEVLISSKED